jgi:uncharacterized membrane protein YhaH (DUF805 family)
MNGWQYFIGAVKKYAVFKGRARRSEYWWFTLFYSIFIYGLLCIDVAVLYTGAILSNIFTFSLLLPALGVGVRRMHDVNKSGWFILVPIYNLVLACTEGTSGPNRFGDDPKTR